MPTTNTNSTLVTMFAFEDDDDCHGVGPHDSMAWPWKLRQSENDDGFRCVITNAFVILREYDNSFEKYKLCSESLLNS